jgi:hypothetical protein
MTDPEDPEDSAYAWFARLLDDAGWLGVIGALLLLTGGCALVLILWPS